MTSEGLQPGHEPDEAARGANGPAPHGGQGTTYGQRPAAEDAPPGAGWAPHPGQPAVGAWGVAEDAPDRSPSVSWTVPAPAPRVESGEWDGRPDPATWTPPNAGPTSGGGGAGWAPQQPGGDTNWPPQPQQPGGDAGWPAQSQHPAASNAPWAPAQPGGGDRAWPPAGPDQAAGWAPQQPDGDPGWPAQSTGTGSAPNDSPRWTTADIPASAPSSGAGPTGAPAPTSGAGPAGPGSPMNDGDARPFGGRGGAPEPWSAEEAWGTARRGPEPSAADDHGFTGVGAQHGYGDPAGPPPGMPQRERGRQSESLYQSDGADSMAFGAMSQDSGELPTGPHRQNWPDGAPEGARQPFEPRPVGRAAPPFHDDAGAEPPSYQPGPAPGISPANAVPLPPQETRVPGASLAASLPDEYGAGPGWGPEQHGGAADQGPAGGYGEPGGYGGQNQPGGYGEPGRAGAPGPTSPPPFVPQPRTSSDSLAEADPAEPHGDRPAAGHAVTASASVPLSSRVMPPTDYGMRPAGHPAPQPRMYGRPAEPEAEPGYDRVDHRDEPEQAAGIPAQRAPSVYGRPATYGGPERSAEPADPGLDVYGRRPDAGEPRMSSAGGGFPSAPGPFGDLVDGDQDGRGQRPDGPGPFDQGGRDPYEQRAPEPYQPGGPNAFDRGGPQDFEPGPDNRPPANNPFGPRPDQDYAGRPDQTMVASPFSAPPTAGPVSGGGRGPASGAAAVPMPAFGGPADGPGYGGPGDGSGFGGPAGGPGRGSTDPEQDRFSSYQPTPQQPAKEEPAPTPHVRNGRVLVAVLTAAILLLLIPLGAVWLFTRGGDDATYSVGDCVKREGNVAAEATCGDPNTFKVTAKEPTADKCPDPKQPHVVVKEGDAEQVLCLQPAGS